MFAGSMPNFLTSASAVETATKCLATARSSPSALTHHARAVRVVVSVSSVVNVFDATMNSVSAGSRSRVDATKSAPSTLDTKRSVSRGAAYARSAAVIMAGPRAEPPRPRLAMLRIGRSANPLQAPLRRRRVEHRVHARHDVLAVDDDARAARRPQRHVQHRATLGGVDRLAGEHRVHALAHAARAREIQQ